MQFNYKVNGDRLIQISQKNTAYSGNVNTYMCCFEFSEEWSGLYKFMAVAVGGECYVKEVQESFCILPHEAVKQSGQIQIGLYGTNGSEDDFKRISTNWETLIVGAGAYSENTTSPTPPMPDVWEKLINRNIPQIGDSGNWYIWDIEKNEYTDSGVSAKGEQGPKGDKGDPGYTPQKGVDYFTQEDIEGLELDKKEDKSNKLTYDVFSIHSGNYTDAQYVSAKALVYSFNEVFSVANDAYFNASNALSSLNEYKTSNDNRITGIEGGIDYISANADTALRIARGRGTTRVYNNYTDFCKWMDKWDPSEMTFGNLIIADVGSSDYTPIGSNIYIGTVGVPDLWVMKIRTDEKGSACVITEAESAGVSVDEYIITKLNTQGYFENGVFKIGQLETQKVDLSEYYTKEEEDAKLDITAEVLKNYVDNSIQYAILDSWEVPV